MILENTPKLKELLNKKNEIVTILKEKAEEMQKMDEFMKKASLDLQEVKEQIMIEAHETVMTKLSDEEMAGTIELNDKGEVEVEVFNVVEEAKKANIDQKTKLNNSVIDLKAKHRKDKKKKAKKQAKK